MTGILSPQTEALLIEHAARREVAHKVRIEQAALAAGLPVTIMELALAGVATLPNEDAQALLRDAQQARIRMHNGEASRRSHKRRV